MRNVLEKLIQRENLTSEEVTEVMENIACGKADPLQVGAFLALLRAKGETATEVAALVKIMIKHCVQVDIEVPYIFN